MSRIETADALGLNKSTVTSIVNALMEEGLIRVDSVGDSSPAGGRKPVYLALNESFGNVIGVEIRPESYTCVAVDLSGSIVSSRSERLLTSGANLAENFAEIIRRIEPDQARIGTPLLGVGVGFSGVVDPRRRLIRYSIPFNIREEYDFGARISADYDVPVFPENDANCCAWGELAFHRHEPEENFMFVVVEFRDIESSTVIHERTAVGIGVSIDGKVYRGRGSSAGEFRSPFRGPEHAGQFSLAPDEAAVVDTDPKIRARFIGELSRSVALLVNTFNLDAVYLGGDIERYQAEVSAALESAIEENWPYEGPVSCEIKFSSLGSRAVAFGAAGMMLDRLFFSADAGDESGALHWREAQLLPGWNGLNVSR